jgi:cell division septation protein DedD
MAHIERGAYEPRISNLQAFDAIDEDDAVEEGSRLPVLIVVALLVLAAFGGVVWLAYTQGVQRGRADAPRTLIADNTPAKSSAAAPQTQATPYAGLKIYQPSNAPDEESDAVPAPPTPVHQSASLPALRPSAGSNVDSPAGLTALRGAPAQSPPVHTAVSQPVHAPTPQPAKRVATAELRTPQASELAPAAPETPRVASHAPRALVKPSLDTQPPPQAQASQSQAAQPEASTAPALASSTDTADATPAPAAPVTHAGTSDSGGFVVQVGSYKSQALADASWELFKSKHSDASAYQSNVKEADLGDKGTWYRLRVAGFADKAAATAFCARLKAQGASCLIAH